MPEHRVGIGFDVHRRTPGRELLLGGVRFEAEEGLDGHSDGDVVCHAIADALLGAAALGDVGMHFPDDDPAFEGIGGHDLLSRTVGIVTRAGFIPSSCDATVVCERPSIGPRRDDMREAIAAALGLDRAVVSVKATRPEGLGLTGEGIGCFAVASLTVAGRSTDAP